MKRFLFILEVTGLCFVLAECSVFAQSHWSDDSPSASLTPSSKENYSCKWGLGLDDWYCVFDREATSSRATVNHSLYAGNGNYVTNYCFVHSMSGGVNASVSRELVRKHTGPSHTPLKANVSGGGTASLSASVSGTALTSASSSASASCSGTLSCLGHNSTPAPGSLSVNGSCSATVAGSIGVTKDGGSASITPSAPGSYSGASTHAAALTIPSGTETSGSRVVLVICAEC